GTGVLSRRADFRWKRSQQERDVIIKKQAELIEEDANVVSIGGRLVYSTCSIEPEEKMEQIKNFLKAYENFELQPLDDYLPEEVLSEDGLSYQTYPHKHHCDGHFGVLLKRIH